MVPATQKTLGDGRMRHRSTTVIVIGFLMLLCDGYDMIVFGSTVPALLEYEDWGLSPAAVGSIGSLALLGMIFGSLFSGWIASRIGSRALVLASVSLFSVVTAATGLAPNPELFALLRFVTGLGLGSLMPTAVALVVEFSKQDRRQFNNAVMSSGFAVGGVICALVALVVLPSSGFRTMYFLAIIPIFTIVPLAWRFLPESMSFLISKGRIEEARTLAARYGHTIDAGSQESQSGGAFAAILRGPRVLPLLFLTLATLCVLLVYYGINTWLPDIMRHSGYSLGGSLSFLFAFNLGAVAGTILMSRVADRMGTKRVVIAIFFFAGVAITILSFSVPLPLAMTLVVIAGLGTFGSQILISGFTAAYFPAHERTTAVGTVIGVGRIGAVLGPFLGGWIAGSSLGVLWNFYLFAAVAIVGCAAFALVRKASATDNTGARSSEGGTEASQDGGGH